jgi:hypothetical protein
MIDKREYGQRLCRGQLSFLVHIHSLAVDIVNAFVPDRARQGGVRGAADQPEPAARASHE